MHKLIKNLFIVTLLASFVASECIVAYHECVVEILDGDVKEKDETGKQKKDEKKDEEQKYCSQYHSHSFHSLLKNITTYYYNQILSNEFTEVITPPPERVS